MPLVLQAPTERLALTTPGEWVEIKTRVSVATVKKIEAAGMKFRMTDAMTPDFELAMDEVYFAALDAMVTGWSFETPLTPENLRCLTPEDYDVITARLNEILPGRLKDDDRKN